jgi:hypothetical protein
VIAFCRKIFEQQPAFDFQFGLDDSTLYCLELTEKAFRSQGLILSQPVRIGDWERLADFPLTALAMPYGSRMVTGRPITLEQPVYLPGNEREGIWSSTLLETVFGPAPMGDEEDAPAPTRGLSLKGDVMLIIAVLDELRRSYSDLPVRWLYDHTRQIGRQRLLAARGPEAIDQDLYDELDLGASTSRGAAPRIPARSGAESPR